MSLTRLSQANGVSCRWIFKHPACAVVDFLGNGAIQAGYAEEDYATADEGLGYAN